MPANVTHANRPAVQLGNGLLEATFVPGGGHLAALRLPGGGVNPLWEPPWPSAEPVSGRGGVNKAVYGDGVESRLLAGILGQNLCLDIFGGPSAAEAKAGLGVHGEAPVLQWHVEPGVRQLGSVDGITCRVNLPVTQIDFVRQAWLVKGSPVLHIEEHVTSRLGFDRPFGWCQHVTLGEAFLTPGPTLFDASVARAQVHPGEFGDARTLKRGEEFAWPHAPLTGGGTHDMRHFPRSENACDFTAQLMREDSPWAWFTAINHAHGVMVGYIWPRAVFPWLGIWEENRSRTNLPWSGKALCRGMEFANQPLPETRETLAEFSPLLGKPAVAWLHANETQTARYAAWMCKVPASAKGVNAVEIAGGKLKVAFDGATAWEGEADL